MRNRSERWRTGFTSHLKPIDALVEWLEAAIAGEPEAEAVIEAVQEARRKAKAFEWLFAKDPPYRTQSVVVLVSRGMDPLAAVQTEMRRNQ